MHIYTHTHIHTYVYIHACVYKHTYVCIHTHTDTHDVNNHNTTPAPSTHIPINSIIQCIYSHHLPSESVEIDNRYISRYISIPCRWHLRV